MTKKKNQLKWRLRDLPDATEIADLVKTSVISKEEARELLFSEENKDEKIKALEEEIKFLRGLVDTLASKHNGWGTIVHEYRDYTPRYSKYWYDSYGTVMSTLSTVGDNSSITLDAGSTTLTTTGSTSNAVFTTPSSDMGLSSLNK